MHQPYLFPEYEQPGADPAPTWRHTPASARKTWLLLQRWRKLNLTPTEKNILLALACGESTPKTIARYTDTTPANVQANLRSLKENQLFYNYTTKRTESMKPPVCKKPDRTWSLTETGRRLVDGIIYAKS